MTFIKKSSGMRGIWKNTTMVEEFQDLIENHRNEDKPDIHNVNMYMTAHFPDLIQANLMS